jgi:hypothetical protein
MYAAPQTCRNSALWVSSRPRFCVKTHRVALRVPRVDFKAVQFRAWLPASGLGSSQICTQAGHEFARPKRLCHVVVRAGLEPTHLRLLIAHGR